MCLIRGLRGSKDYSLAGLSRRETNTALKAKYEAKNTNRANIQVLLIQKCNDVTT